MSDRDSFDTLAPEFRVEIDGKEIPEQLRADLQAIRVLEDLHATGMFSIRVNCWDGAEMKVKWIDEDLVSSGTPVLIQMGYRDKFEKLMSGEINGLEPDFNTQEAPTLTIRGYD